MYFAHDAVVIPSSCKYTQADNDEISKTTDGKFVDGMDGKKLDCGEQPTGFAIDGTASAVKFEIFIKGQLQCSRVPHPQRAQR